LRRRAEALVSRISLSQLGEGIPMLSG
jgi:hypothetical protein